MPRPVSWWRLYRGKVWHVSLAGDPAGMCGQDAEVHAERTTTYPPVNARICSDCTTAALQLYEITQGAGSADPRFLQQSDTLVAQ